MILQAVAVNLINLNCFLITKNKNYEIAFNKQKASANEMLPPNKPLSAKEFPNINGQINKAIVRN